jgi:4-carboxymuconolactone decarboxylase
MTRIPQLTDRDQLDDEGRDAFDAVAARRGGRVGGPFGVMMHSPQVAARVARLGDYLRFDCVLDPAERELAIISVAREFDAELEWAAHVRLARENGVSDQTVEVVANRGDLAALEPHEAQIVAYVRELLGPAHRVSDATFEAARARLGERGVVDLTALVATALGAPDVGSAGPRDSRVSARLDVVDRGTIAGCQPRGGGSGDISRAAYTGARLERACSLARPGR